jgi:phosphoglycolate phosphatase-like HAD superfamily hydrolase
MRQPAVLVDIDNTLVDTAIRKLRLLETFTIAGNRDLDSVRTDYWLKDILGDETSPRSQEFFRFLEAPEAIEGFPAPLIAGAKETIAWLSTRGFTVHYVSGRPRSLHSATLRELRGLGLVVDEATLRLSDRAPGDLSSHILLADSAKVREIKALAQAWDVLAVVGDRPEDILAGNAAGVPTVLLTSTLSATEVRESAGIAPPSVCCASWPEVAIALARFESGDPALGQQRQQLADQYSSWLGDIDEKSQTTVLIAGALSALTTPVLTGKEFSFERDWLLVGALLLAIVSMVFAIRSFTSIYTSGKQSAREIPVRFRQVIAVLLGFPARWKAQPDDALGEYEALKQADAATKARAHLRFFEKRYNTVDPNVIMNMRLYAMRANNYAKVYPERWASKLLILAIFLAFVWIVLKVADYDLFAHLRHFWSCLKLCK